MKKLTTGLLALTLLVSACITTENDTSGAGAAKRSLATSMDGWTTEFLRRRLIVADEIRVTGPQGLRNHMATRFDPSTMIRVEKTTPEGYLQVFTQKAGQLDPLTSYLDKLEIHATRRLTILERPGPVHVVVDAVGDVYFVDLDANDEERVSTLRLTGRIQR